MRDHESVVEIGDVLADEGLVVRIGDLANEDLVVGQFMSYRRRRRVELACEGWTCVLLDDSIRRCRSSRTGC